MAQAILRALAGRPEPSKETKPEPKSLKVLRVGLIEDGRIVDEQIITRRTSVSIGPSERCTFVVPSAELPPRFELLERVGEGYRLNFTESMAGRVARGGSAEDLEALRRSGAAKRKGPLFQVPLDESARGKVALSGVTLLFQFVTPPPVQPRPQLPASVRGRWTREVDWAFASILLLSCAAQLGLVLYLVNADWPAQTDFALLPDSLQERILTTPPSQFEIEQRLSKLAPRAEEPGTAPAEAETPAEPVAAVARPRAPRAEPATGRPAPASAPAEDAEARRARLRDALTKAAQAHIVTSVGGPGSVYDDTLRAGRPSTDIDAILEQVREVEVASASSGPILRRPTGGSRDGSNPEAVDIGTLRRSETVSVASDAMGTERVPPGKVRPGPPTPGPGPGDIPPDVVRRIVGQNLGGIKACYERALPRNPTLAGRITVQFVIGSGGRVVSARAAEDSMGESAVTDCVTSRFRAMRFPEPRGGNASFSFPFIFRPGQ